MKGILGGPVDGPARLATVYPVVEARTGATVRHRASGFTGTVVTVEQGALRLRGATGVERLFPLDAGAFALDGVAVTLTAPRPTEGTAARTTASGSRAVDDHRARVARAGRIYVEGIHDAELVEAVWGDDLRVEGVVVERLDGVDHLADAVRAFAPGAGRRLGVLVDHLVDGSKEARLAAAVRHPHVLVTGTPYVDVWEAVRPRLVGLDAWPEVPKGRPWKDGVCAALGETNPGAFWRRLLSTVTSYRDLETPFVGAVEALVDFVTGA
jgi:DUF3097 family protein